MFVVSISKQLKMGGLKVKSLFFPLHFFGGAVVFFFIVPP